MIYLIEAKTHLEMVVLEIPHAVSMVFRKRHRRAVVSYPVEAGELKFPPGFVVEKHPLMSFDSACRTWLNRTIVDDLLDDYKKNPPTLKTAAAAERAYFKAMARIPDCERKLEEAREVLKECAADLVRVYGRGPIEMREQIYELCTVLNDQGTYVYWRNKEEFMEKRNDAIQKREAARKVIRRGR